MKETFAPGTYLAQPLPASPAATQDDLTAGHARMSAKMIAAAGSFAGEAFATALRADLEAAVRESLLRVMPAHVADAEFARWLHALDQELEDAERVGSSLH